MTNRVLLVLATLRARFAGLASGVRFGQFASVGIVGAICDNAMLALLKLGFGVPATYAKFAGIETAIIVMFLLNDRWTFADQGGSDLVARARRLLKSNVVRIGGILIQLAVYDTLVHGMDVTLLVAGTDLWFLAASPIAIAAAMFVNYLAESLFTWKVDEPS